MIQVNYLRKEFGKRTVLQNVSFLISKGEIIGLVGPNGSGKTTLLNILMGMIKPTAGSFNITNGTRIGMSVSRKGFFDDMTVVNNIFVHSDLMGCSREHALEVMREFAIDFGHLRFGGLSAGMKQRVSLLLPFLSKNDLIFLDEPSNHLDIDSIILLRQKVLKLKLQGVSFLIASHIFSDLEKVCDRLLFLKIGQLVRDVKTALILEQYSDFEDAYVQILK